MAQERVFPGVGFRSHMPFFDGQMLVFCRSDEPVRREFECGGEIWERMRTNRALAEHFRGLARTRWLEYRAWKLYFTSWGKREPQRLATGLAEEAVECSPAVFRRGDKLHVSFIGGIPGKGQIRYRLYQMAGPSWKQLSEAKPVLSRATRVGCVGPDYIVCGRGRELLVLNRDQTPRWILECPLERVLRVSFRAKQEQHLLITGLDKDGRYPTLLYRLGSGVTEEIRSEEGVYKASVFGEQMVSARRSEEGFEERELWHGGFQVVAGEKPIRRRKA